MFEIERHITKLLLSNDCVIVPGFGGFIAHHVEAMFDEGSRTFYPPIRTLGFNPQLTMNDSMLAQSFIEVYDISYPEAISRIENEIDLLKSEIEKNGLYEISELGTICLRNDGFYDFSPCESGILTPNLYGLSSFCMDVFDALIVHGDSTVYNDLTNCLPAKHSTVISRQNVEKVVDEQHCVSLKFSFSMLRNISAACLIIALFILFPLHVGNNEVRGLLKSELDTNLLFNLIPTDITHDITQSSNNIKCSIDSVAQSDTSNLKHKNINKKKGITDNYYTIVLASKVSQKNAQSFVNSLHSKGYKDAKVLVEGRYSKVIYKEYNTVEEAAKERNTLSDNYEFADAWIKKIIKE